MANFEIVKTFLSLLFLPSFLFSQISMNVDSVGLWWDHNLPTEVSHSKYNEVWGFVQNGREYGVIGSKAGTYIIDVSNPSLPRKAAYIPGAYEYAINRDYHDYNGYLYMVCDQGYSTLQIADLRYLPDSVHLVYDSDDLFSNCHNIFIDSYTGHLYCCDVHKQDTVDLDLEIYDISTSYIPQRLLTYNIADVAAFHDIYVVRDTAWGNNGRTGLFIYDFSDMSDPRVMSSLLDYPDKGFNHAGYATPDKKYYYFTDETKGMDIKAVDCSNLADPVVVSLFNSGNNDEGVVAHNCIVHNNKLYVSYYHEGLQVYSLADPAKPVKIADYLTYNLFYKPDPDKPARKDFTGYRGAWGVYPFLPSELVLVSDREKGLFILRLDTRVMPLRTIFPNPFHNEWDIYYPAANIERIDVYEINGRKVQENLHFDDYDKTSHVRMDGKLDAGVYIIKVQGKYETFSIKAVKW